MRTINYRCSWRLAALLAGVFLLSGCAGLLDRPADTAAVPMQMRDRQLIVTLSGDQRAQWVTFQRGLGSDYGLTELKAFPLPSIDVQCVVYEVPAERSITAVQTQLAADPRVETVQPNQTFASLASAAHGDPYASLQYGVKAVGADQAHRWSTGKGVTVAVVDTGADKNHPDLRGRITYATNFVQGGFRSLPYDRHGTAVAGVIAATANNDEGIFGVAPDAKLLVAKACWHPDGEDDKAVCSSWTIARAIDFAIKAGARVLNLSLAGPTDPLVTRLLETADDRDVIVVAAVDEDAPAPSFPASLPAVIAVVASDVRGQVRLPAWGRAAAGFVAAPGVEIITTRPGAAYDFMSGSSLATAHVSGVIALLLQRTPGLTPAAARRLLHDTAQPLAPGGALAPSLLGQVNAPAALDSLGWATASAAPARPAP